MIQFDAFWQRFTIASIKSKVCLEDADTAIMDKAFCRKLKEVAP